MTDFALTKLLNKLDKWYKDDESKIDALTNSIMNGWLSIYEPNGKSYAKQDNELKFTEGGDLIE
jgi:hypothetical protein